MIPFKPKLLAFDLDGTLVEELSDNVSPKNIAILNKLQAAGVFVTIVTGRDRVHSKIKSAFNFDLITSSNGGYIEEKNISKKNLYFTQEELQDILNCDLDVRIIIYSNTTIYTDKDRPLPRWMYDREVCHIEDFNINMPVNKVSFMHQKIAEFADKLKKLRPNLVYSHAQPPYAEYLVITPNGANKGSAIEWMANYLNVNLSECVVFGDTDNDISMFQKAFGIQIGDVESLKKFAQYNLKDISKLSIFLEDVYQTYFIK